jgi:hypothetical protein
MPEATTRSTPQLASRGLPMAAMTIAGIAGVLVAAAIALWVYFGGAVFYEMLLAGIAACF